MTLEELVGRRLVFGIPGTRVTEDDVRLFQKTHAGGLVLYRINFESPAELVKLIRSFEEALGRSLLVMADHEGGRVIMFREGVTIFPDNLAVGTVGDPELAERQGTIEARELRRLGIDVNLAPVLDVLTEGYSPNIGIRSYGKDPGTAARLGAARIRAMQAGGLSACAKHFPGKGHSPLDAHLALPTILSTWEEMERLHLVPFRAAIEAGVDVIMTSHPVYPNLDPTPRLPTTFSRRIVREYLREGLGYSGVISSDDLEMGAIRELCPTGEAAVHAAQAGHDLLLSCHAAKSQWEVFTGLLDAYRSKRLAWRDLEASEERLNILKARRTARFEGGPPHPEPEGAMLGREIARRAVTIVREGVPDLHAGLRRRLGVIFPRFSSLDPRIMIERPLLDEGAFLREQCGRFGVTPEIALVAMEPTDEEIESAVGVAARSDLTVLFLFDAHLFPSNRKLLDGVQKSDHSLAVVLLRDPYDADFLAPGVLGVTAYGFRICQIEAVIERLMQQD